MYDPTIATLGILAGVLLLGVLFAAIQVLMYLRHRAEVDELRSELVARDARLELLEANLRTLAERVDVGEELCDGWHDRVRSEYHKSDDERREREALGERVRQLEEAAAPQPAPLAIAASPMLVDLVDPEPAAFFHQLGGMPALTEPTGYVPIVPTVARAMPIDNTETNFTRAKVAEVLARLDEVEVVDAQELAEVTA